MQVLPKIVAEKKRIAKLFFRQEKIYKKSIQKATKVHLNIMLEKIRQILQAKEGIILRGTNFKHEYFVPEAERVKGVVIGASGEGLLTKIKTLYAHLTGVLPIWTFIPKANPLAVVLASIFKTKLPFVYKEGQAPQENWGVVPYLFNRKEELFFKKGYRIFIVPEIELYYNGVAQKETIRDIIGESWGKYFKEVEDRCLVPLAPIGKSSKLRRLIRKDTALSNAQKAELILKLRAMQQEAKKGVAVPIYAYDYNAKKLERLTDNVTIRIDFTKAARSKNFITYHVYEGDGQVMHFNNKSLQLDEHGVPVLTKELQDQFDQSMSVMEKGIDVYETLNYRFMDTGVREDELSKRRKIAEAIAVENRETARKLSIKEKQLEEIYWRNMASHLLTLYEKEPYTALHCFRVTEYNLGILKKLGYSERTNEYNIMKLYSVLHDIGKILTEVEILKKPSSLTSAEYERIRKHPQDGAKILRIGNPLAAVLAEIHHERVDGRGHPNKIVLAEDESMSGEFHDENITFNKNLLGRVLALSDAFDALTSERPYDGKQDVVDSLQTLMVNTFTQLGHVEMLALLKYQREQIAQARLRKDGENYVLNYGLVYAEGTPLHALLNGQIPDISSWDLLLTRDKAASLERIDEMIDFLENKIIPLQEKLLKFKYQNNYDHRLIVSIFWTYLKENQTRQKSIIRKLSDLLNVFSNLDPANLEIYKKLLKGSREAQEYEWARLINKVEQLESSKKPEVLAVLQKYGEILGDKASGRELMKALQTSLLYFAGKVNNKNLWQWLNFSEVLFQVIEDKAESTLFKQELQNPLALNTVPEDDVQNYKELKKITYSVFVKNIAGNTTGKMESQEKVAAREP